MPPPIPRSSLSSLPRCKSSHAVPLASRAFTTSTPLSLIGPENPKFIEIPQPPQRYAIRPRNIKGTLPPPRDIFPLSGRVDDLPRYIKRTLPKSEKPLSEPANERVAWKRQMTETRRKNLEESLYELRNRYTARKNRVVQIGAQKSQARKLLVNAPQREDERLTNPTITETAFKLQSGTVPDPGREQRIAEKKARVAAIEIAKVEARKDALHTLYMHARDFIVTQEQLDDEIEKIFTEFPFVNEPNKTNIWDAYGAPATVEDMLTIVNNAQKTAIRYHRSPAGIMGKRMRTIAEELTGGKMD